MLAINDNAYIFYSSMSTIELPRNKEQEYRITSWLGTLAVMEGVGSLSPMQTRKFEKLSHHLFNVCRMVDEKPEKIPFLIHKWMRNKHKNEERLSELGDVGIITKNLSVIDADFETAFTLFTDKALKSEIIETTPLGRLMDVTDELSHHYQTSIKTDSILQLDLTKTLAQVHRDLDFYIGHYDPAA